MPLDGWLSGLQHFALQHCRTALRDAAYLRTPVLTQTEAISYARAAGPANSMSGGRLAVDLRTGFRRPLAQTFHCGKEVLF